MAHPALWTFGGIAVALVATGVWLNRPTPEPAPTAPVATPVAPEPEPVATLRETEPEPDAGTEPQPEPTPAPATPPPEPEPSPTTAAPVSQPPSDTDLPPKGEATPAPRATPEPDTPPAPVQDIRALTRYRGAPVWQLDPLDRYTEAQRRIIENALNSLHAEAHYFGAVAFSMDSGAFGIVTGYAALATAEAAALRQCDSTCEIVARLVPEDFDGQRENTLNAEQAAAVSRLNQTSLLQATRTAWYYVLAWSEDGAVGTGALADEAAARTVALADCATAQRAMHGPDSRLPACRAVTVATPLLPPRP